MLDLHTHILPGVDDGPDSMEESMEMARLAFAGGTRIIVATPHNRDVVERSSISTVRSLVDEMNRLLQAEALPVTVLMGMENHLEMDTPQQVERGLALPIEGTRYILLEFPFEFYPFYAEDVVFKLQLQGLKPIIVHPERIAPIMDDVEVLANLVGKGALSQVTAGSIAGRFGKDVQRFTRELLRKDLVHIIASDGHTARGERRPVLSAGLEAAIKLVGEAAAMKMVEDVPAAVVEDRDLDPEELPRARRRRRWALLR